MKKRNRKTDGKGKNVTKLLVAMTGKASAAKAAEGDKPVFDYVASLPQPQRGIAERARRATSSLVDEAGRREPIFRGKETMTKDVISRWNGLALPPVGSA